MALGGSMAIRGLARRVALAAIGATIAVLGVPGVSSAASAPSCGNASDSAPHCHVEADLGAPGGIPSFTSMAGLFSAPVKLAVKAPAYSIAQIALGFGGTDIELGWIVDPGAYKDQRPHLFVYFRRIVPSQYSLIIPNFCSVGIPGENSQCPSNDYEQLSSKYSAGMAIGGTPAFFYVGFDATNDFWYIQYQNQYIARMSESWWTCGSACPDSFKAGDDASWFGEVYTPSSSYSCTPMGNGHYGSQANSASVSDMLYGNGGPTLLAASPTLDETHPGYWDSNRAYGETFTSSFQFGGPGDC